MWFSSVVHSHIILHMFLCLREDLMRIYQILLKLHQCFVRNVIYWILLQGDHFKKNSTKHCKMATLYKPNTIYTCFWRKTYSYWVQHQPKSNGLYGVGMAWVFSPNIYWSDKSQTFRIFILNCYAKHHIEPSFILFGFYCCWSLLFADIFIEWAPAG